MKFVNKILNYLPDNMRWQLMRGKIRLPFAFPPELHIRLAENPEELKAAYTILQESYEEEGLAMVTNSGMRVLKQFAMPSTATIIILWNEEVIGTVSLIRDNPLGLPLEKIFDLSSCRERNLHLAEVSSLAISSKFRSKHGKLLFPLFKAVYQFGKDVLRVDGLVIAVNPRWRDFYSGLYGFKPLESKVVESYDFVNGAPAIGLIFEYEPAYSELKELYRDAPPERNIFSQLWESSYSCLTLPKFEYFSTVIRHIDANSFREFFLKDDQTFSKMNPLEQLMVKRSLVISERDMLPELESIAELTPRENHRFDSNLKNLQPHVKIKIHDVSRAGVKLEVCGSVEKHLGLDVEVAPGKSARLVVEPNRRDSETGLWGAKILQCDEDWMRFIDYQEYRLGIGQVNNVIQLGKRRA